MSQSNTAFVGLDPHFLDIADADADGDTSRPGEFWPLGLVIFESRFHCAIFLEVTSSRLFQ